MRAYPGAFVLALAAPVAALAQTAPKPAFEVASIRPAAPGTRAAQRMTETRLDFVNTALHQVLLTAFRVEEFRLEAPAWLNTTRFDIQGTYPEGAKGQFPEMLRTLLAERFGLVAHIESRPIEVYELVVAKGGITMREAEALNEIDKNFTDRTLKPFEMTFETLEGPVLRMMWPGGTRAVTARSRYDLLSTAQGSHVLDAARMTMADLASVLKTNLDRPVVDKTGLTGVYQFRIELDANLTNLRLFRGAGLTTNARGEPIDVPTGVSTFNAVESLGLKLENRRSPFDVVVVDRIERNPIEN